jgi:hypothetical protein
LTAFDAFAPYIAQRFKGVPLPIEANFAATAWREPVSLQPGDAITQKVFTALWDAPKPVSFVIDVSKVGMKKVVQ